jgi:chromosome segregation ATPase
VSELSVVVQHLADSLDRLEDKVDNLQDRMATRDDIDELKDDIKALKDDQSKMAEVVGKWKAGAGIIFGLGAAAMWVLDNWDKVRKMIGL